MMIDIWGTWCIRIPLCLSGNEKDASHIFMTHALLHSQYSIFTTVQGYLSIQIFPNWRCVILFLNLNHNRTVLIRFF